MVSAIKNVLTVLAVAIIQKNHVSQKANYRKKAEGSLAEGFYRSRIRMPDRVSDAAASPSARSHSSDR